MFQFVLNNKKIELIPLLLSYQDSHILYVYICIHVSVCGVKTKKKCKCACVGIFLFLFKYLVVTNVIQLN